MKKKYSLLIAFGIALLLIGIDQLSKWLCNTNETLLSGDKINVINNVISFKLAYNKGAAWSILEGKKFILVSISLLASVIVGFMIVKLIDFKNNKLLSSALILIFSGSVGNLIDRAFYSKGVIDFLHLEFMEFPTFNFADSCLTVGAVVLMVYVLFFYKETNEPKKRETVNEDEDIIVNQKNN